MEISDSEQSIEVYSRLEKNQNWRKHAIICLALAVLGLGAYLLDVYAHAPGTSFVSGIK